MGRYGSIAMQHFNQVSLNLDVFEEVRKKFLSLINIR